MKVLICGGRDMNYADAFNELQRANESALQEIGR